MLVKVINNHQMDHHHTDHRNVVMDQHSVINRDRRGGGGDYGAFNNGQQQQRGMDHRGEGFGDGGGRRNLEVGWDKTSCFRFQICYDQE